MGNRVRTPEIKTIVYAERRQFFTEDSNFETDIKTDSFLIGERKEQIVHKGNKTIVILDDGSKGVAKCSPTDQYNKLTGVKIAYHRAKIKSLQKELQKLIEA